MPSLAYSCLVHQELFQELQKVWVRLEERARGTSGELKFALPKMEHVLMKVSWQQEMVAAEVTRDEFTAGTE
jgi:hypothetical protein